MPVNPSDILQPLFSWRSIVASAAGPKSPVTRHVLLTLALHMNEKGLSCFPSIDLLVEETGLSKPTVINHIKKAVDECWLEKKIRGSRGKKWRSHEYRPLIPEELSLEGGKAGLPPVNHCNTSFDNPPQAEGGKAGLPPVSSGGKSDSVKVVKEVYSSTSMSTSIKKQPQKTAASAKSKKQLSDHAWFTSWWCFVTEQATGSKYPYKKKDAGQIKQILKLVGSLENLISRSCVYISWPAEKRFPKGSLTIGGLLYQIAEVSDLDDDLYNRFVVNGYLPDDSGSEQIILKEFQPWKECNVTAAAS